MVKNKNFSKNLAMLLALAVFSGNAGAVPAGPHSKDKKPTSLAKHSISFGALGSLGVLSLLGLGVYSQREWILIKYYEGKLDSIAEPKELIRTANKFLPFIKSWEKEIRKDSSARSRIPEKYTNFYTKLWEALESKKLIGGSAAISLGILVNRQGFEPEPEHEPEPEFVLDPDTEEKIRAARRKVSELGTAEHIMVLGIDFRRFRRSLEKSSEILLRQPAFLELRNKFTIYASDLHGDSGATGRLFEYFLRTLESGKDSQIVILGDLDEGINMFQVYLLIAELHVLFPGRIFLTMGNHEIEPKFGFVYSYEKLNKTGDAYGKYAGYIYGEWAQSLPLAVKVGEHTVACHGFWHHNLDSIEKLNGLEKTKAFENGSSENYMLFSDPFDTFDEDRIFEIRNLTDEARIYPITGRLKIGSLLFANTLRKIFPKVNAYISGHLHSMSSQRQMFKVGDSDFGIYKTSINGLAKEGPNAGNRIDIQPNFFCFLVQENPDSEPNDIYRVNIDTLETYRYS